MMYRIQHPTTLHGMWSTLDDEGLPMVHRLAECPVASEPMPFSLLYGHRNRRWYSAVPSLRVLYQWFSRENLAALVELGFLIYEVHANETFSLPNEVIFTKESITSWRDVTAKFSALQLA